MGSVQVKLSTYLNHSHAHIKKHEHKNVPSHQATTPANHVITNFSPYLSFYDFSVRPQ